MPPPLRGRDRGVPRAKRGSVGEGRKRCSQVLRDPNIGDEGYGQEGKGGQSHGAGVPHTMNYPGGAPHGRLD